MKLRNWIILFLLTAMLYANSPFFGVQTHFGQFWRYDMDSTSVEQQLDMIQAAGIEMIRDECLWSEVEKDSGIYVIPPRVDHYVRSALSRGIDIYLILNYNNTLYAPSSGSGVTNDTNRIAYARYCQAVVNHFSPLGVKHYEIWNEPNHGVLFWTPQPNANDYTALLQTAYDSIKAVDSSTIVIGCATSPAIGNPAPYIEGLDFIRDVFAAGGGDHMDAVSFHLYQIAYRPENELISYLSNVKSYVGEKPIYLSEFGYPTHDGWPNITLEKQAQYITRMFLICQTDPQMRSALYYDLKNDGTVLTEPEHNFGLLEFDKTPKLSYLALKQLIGKTQAQMPTGIIQDNDRYLLTYSDSLSVGWTYSGIKNIKHHTGASYTRTENMYGDTLAYNMTANDSIYLTLNENPRYFINQSVSPRVETFSFDHHDYLLYPNEELKLSYYAEDPDGIDIIADPSCISWSYTGSYGHIFGNIFTATASEEGMIIAELDGKVDTINIKILDDPSTYIVEDFSDTSGFILASTYLDMENSSISSFSEGQDHRLQFDYEYSGSAAIAYIYKDILINHHADSIFIDLITDEKEYDLRLYCKDGNGSSYTLYMKPRPTDWTNSLGTCGCAVDISSSAVPPVRIQKIYLKLRPGTTTQTEPYSGKIYLDNISIKRSTIVGTGNKDIIPSSIRLSQNYPNPFNGNTRINFYLPQNESIRLDIYNLRGELILTALNRYLSSGEHTIDLDLSGLASGVYIYKLSSTHNQINKKFVYLK